MLYITNGSVDDFTDKYFPFAKIDFLFFLKPISIANR